MPRFIEGLKKTITGKTAIERKQEAAANAIIRRKVLAAELKEREVQSIKLAQETVRERTKQKLQQIKQPRGANYRNYGNAFGQPRFVKQRPVVRKVRTKVRKGKKARKKMRSSPRPSISRNVAPQKYDVIGF